MSNTRFYDLEPRAALYDLARRFDAYIQGTQMYKCYTSTESDPDGVVVWIKRDDVFAGRADVRLVAPEALHVTLVFLGHLPEEKIPRNRYHAPVAATQNAPTRYAARSMCGNRTHSTGLNRILDQSSGANWPFSIT